MKIGDKITFEKEWNYGDKCYSLSNDRKAKEPVYQLSRATNTYEILEIEGEEVIFDYDEFASPHFIMSIKDIEELFGKLETQNYEIY